MWRLICRMGGRRLNFAMDPLCPFVIDAQMDRHPTMTVGWMLAMREK